MELEERQENRCESISLYPFISTKSDDAVDHSLGKSAVVSFTRAQALEWAPYNIQINSIAPGFFPDPQTYGEEYTRQAESISKRVPLHRAGLLREVGLLALYLVSSASDYMTGQTLFLDGGLTL